MLRLGSEYCVCQRSHLVKSVSPQSPLLERPTRAARHRPSKAEKQVLHKPTAYVHRVFESLEIALMTVQRRGSLEAKTSLE